MPAGVWCRHEEREAKAGRHVSWWKRLTGATANAASDGGTPTSDQQGPQDPDEDVEAGPAGA